MILFSVFTCWCFFIRYVSGRVFWRFANIERRQTHVQYGASKCIPFGLFVLSREVQVTVLLPPAISVEAVEREAGVRNESRRGRGGSEGGRAW